MDDPLVLVLWVGPTAILGAIKQNFTDLQVKDTFKKKLLLLHSSGHGHGHDLTTDHLNLKLAIIMFQFILIHDL